MGILRVDPVKALGGIQAIGVFEVVGSKICCYSSLSPKYQTASLDREDAP